jgi:AraC-like DNA-binding protein
VSSDPLSDVLRLLEARSVVTGGFSAGGAWALRFPAPAWIKFSAIVTGSCWLRIDGQRRAVTLAEGDVFLYAGKRGFVVGNDAKARVRDYRDVFGEGGRFVDVGGTDCVVLAGQVLLHPAMGSFFLESVPDLVHVRATQAEAAGLRWIVERIVVERRSSLPGSGVATAQLAQLLFIQALRAHVASGGAMPAGWLRAIGDERLAAALRRMHDEPARSWTLSALAKAAGMSRTSFAVRFKEVAGVAPLGYLAEWRMRLAQKVLRDEETPVRRIAESLGYSSESAFSNAFKRVTGAAPRTYREEARRQRAGDPSPPER